MITGVAPPDWLDKLKSICGAKEEIDGGFTPTVRRPVLPRP